jgi:hypothetical protein
VTRCWLAVACGAALLLTGCGLEGPQGAGVTITSPTPMTETGLPFVVRWTASAPAPGGFAVFVDRAPLPPGKDLRWVVRKANDTACLARPACPDAAWLRSRRIYLVAGTEARVDAVSQPANGRGGGVHRVSVIPLAALGRRTSEAGDSVELVVGNRR